MKLGTSALKGHEHVGRFSPDVRGLFRKSALLNLGIGLSALLIAVVMGRPDEAVILIAAILVVVVWFATCVVSMLMRLYGLFRRLSRRPRRPFPVVGGVSDAWLDGPA